MSLLLSGDLRLRKTPSTWAEGGDLVYTITDSGTTYRVHEFKTVGTSTLTVLNGGEFDCLIVAGGGGGGNSSSVNAGGGGGGGGVLQQSALSIPNGKPSNCCRRGWK
jgi:hypothetical protein